jgi:hypothetical protein
VWPLTTQDVVKQRELKRSNAYVVFFIIFLGQLVYVDPPLLVYDVHSVNCTSATRVQYGVHSALTVLPLIEYGVHGALSEFPLPEYGVHRVNCTSATRVLAY